MSHHRTLERMKPKGTLAATVTGEPFQITLHLPEPDNSELEVLKLRMVDPALTEHQRNLLIETYRVKEVLFSKENGATLALRKLVDILCLRQALYLRSGLSQYLVDVSAAELATEVGMNLLSMLSGVKGLRIEHLGRTTSVDSLIGAVGPQHDRPPFGYAHPRDLIPTDLPRSKEFIEGLVGVFQEGRQSMLDPILAVDDPSRPHVALICEGNHRAAAAQLAGAKVLVRQLRSTAELAYVHEGLVATLRQHFAFEDVVERCRHASQERALYDTGWERYIAVMNGNAAAAHPTTTFLPPARFSKDIRPESDQLSIAHVGGPPSMEISGVRPAKRGHLNPVIVALFRDAPHQTLTADQVTRLLRERGVPSRALPKSMITFLRHGVSEVVENSDGTFSLRPFRS